MDIQKLKLKQNLFTAALVGLMAPLGLYGCQPDSTPHGTGSDLAADTGDASDAQEWNGKELSATFKCTRQSLAMAIKDPLGDGAKIGLGILPTCLALDTVGLVTNTVKVTGRAWDWLVHGRARAKLRDAIAVELRERMPSAAPYLAPYLEEQGEVHPARVVAVILAMVAAESEQTQNQIMLADKRRLTLRDIEKAWGKESDASSTFRWIMYASEEMRGIEDLTKPQIIEKVTALLMGVSPNKRDFPSYETKHRLERAAVHLTSSAAYVVELHKP